MNLALVIVSYALLLPIQLIDLTYLFYRLSRLKNISSCRGNINTALKFRLLCLFLFTLTDLLELVLSQVDQHYWLNQNSSLAFLLLFPFILQITQIIALYSQYRKKVPYNILNCVVWVTGFIANTAILIILAIQKNPWAVNYLVFAIKLVLLSLLIAVTIFKPQDYVQFFHLRMLQTIKLSHYLLIKNSKKIAEQTRRVRDQFEIKTGERQQLISVLKEISEEVINNQMRVMIKLKVNLLQLPKVIKCTEQEVLDFLSKNSSRLNLSFGALQYSNSFSQRLKIFQEQLNLYYEQFGLQNDLVSLLGLSSNDVLLIQKKAKVGTCQDLDQNQGINSQFSSIFSVKTLQYYQVDDHYEYKLDVKLAKLQWRVLKRMANFDQLRNQLKSYSLHPPSIYKGKQVGLRAKSLQTFSASVLNDRSYWKPELWRFFMMQSQVSQIQAVFQISKRLRLKSKISITGFDVALDGKGKPFTRYIIQVGDSPAVAKRRFKDFLALHRQLSIQRPQINLPSLPSKIITKNQQRARLLERYLNQIGEIQGMQSHMQDFLGNQVQQKQQQGIQMKEIRLQTPLEERRLSLLNIRW